MMFSVQSLTIPSHQWNPFTRQDYTKMASTPQQLQNDVIAVLNRKAGPHAQPRPVPSDSLESRFKLTSAQRKTLARLFEEIAQKHKPEASISMTQCEQLKTAGEAVKLVSTAAGFDGTWHTEVNV